jgi:alpha-beta hydrolase superfamily lysophospholipase
MIPLTSPLRTASRVDEYFESRHGYRLCSTRWLLPAGVPLRGALCFCHGYIDYLGPHFDHIASLFAYQGFACYGVEHRGHGRSDGLVAYVPDFHEVVTDFLDWATATKLRFTRDFPSAASGSLPFFVWAESMGGAIAELAALRSSANGVFTGYVFMAPMLGLDAVRRPHWLVERIARCASTLYVLCAGLRYGELLPENAQVYCSCCAYRRHSSPRR